MNNSVVKSFQPILLIDGESYFECILSGNKIMEIALWSFYEFVLENDNGLGVFSSMHEEWESLTEELIEFGYPFEEKLNQYIQLFSNEQITEFTRGI